MQVDDFELAEETPTKQPVSSPPPPLPASPEVTDLQLPHAKIPISADRRTAEWLTALSPVMESDEGTPGLADTPNTTEPSTAGAAPSSPVNPGRFCMPSKYCLVHHKTTASA